MIDWKEGESNEHLVEQEKAEIQGEESGLGRGKQKSPRAVTRDEQMELCLDPIPKEEP